MSCGLTKCHQQERAHRGGVTGAPPDVALGQPRRSATSGRDGKNRCWPPRPAWARGLPGSRMARQVGVE